MFIRPKKNIYFGLKFNYNPNYVWASNASFIRTHHILNGPLSEEFILHWLPTTLPDNKPTDVAHVERKVAWDYLTVKSSCLDIFIPTRLSYHTRNLP